MNDKLMDAFESCLNVINNGGTIEECLQNYPNITDELRPYLEAAIAARSLSDIEIPSEIMTRSRTRMLSRAAQLRSQKPASKSFTRLPLIIFSALMLALVLILGSRELVVVSAESLPGDSLYPIKRAVQDIRVRLAPSREVKHEIEINYREQRIEEVNDLLAIKRIQMVSYEGIVTEMTPNKWSVGNIPVILTENTKVFGNVALGSLVEVEGLTTTEGYIDAHELHLREYEFIGQIESISEDLWIISSLEIEILSSTQIYSGAQIGDEVLVLVRTRDSGIQYAIAIVRLPSYIHNPNAAKNDVASLTAGKNSGEEVVLTGNVDLITSSFWVIDGYSIMVSLLTDVKGGIMPGDVVTVHAIVAQDGSLLAREIDLINGDSDEDQYYNQDENKNDGSDDGQDQEDNSGNDSSRDDSDQDGDHGESQGDNGSGGDDDGDREEHINGDSIDSNDCYGSEGSSDDCSGENVGDDGKSSDGSSSDSSGSYEDGSSDVGSSDAGEIYDDSSEDQESDDGSSEQLPDEPVETEEP